MDKIQFNFKGKKYALASSEAAELYTALGQAMKSAGINPQHFDTVTPHPGAKHFRNGGGDSTLKTDC